MYVLDRRCSALLAVDLQARLAPAIDRIDALLARAELLLRAAVRLGVPVAFTEQSPAGLGPTLAPLTRLVPAAQVIGKEHFRATAEPALPAWIERTGADQVVVFGTEAHVCVLQTSLGLLEAGLAVHVVADAVGSRRPEDRSVALRRLNSAGCRIVTAEMVAFEWLERAGTEEFREVLALIKAVD